MGFSKAITILLGKRYIKIVNVLITDIKYQGFGQVNIEINKYIPSTMQLVYKYHPVIKGWKNYEPNQYVFSKGNESHNKEVIMIVC